VGRRASAAALMMVAWQKISLGRVHASKTVTIAVTQTHLEVDCDDRVRTFRRTNTNPVTHTKAARPRKQSSSFSSGRICPPTKGAAGITAARIGPRYFQLVSVSELVATGGSGRSPLGRTGP
jgi:hypothetical protein